MSGLVLTAVVLAAFLLVVAGAWAHEVDGTLVEQHGDRFDGAPISTRYILKTADADRPLVGDQSRALVGQRVTVRDADPSTAAIEGRARPDGEQRVRAAPAPGPRSLLVILLTLDDAPTASTTVEEARSLVFTAPDSPNAFFEQQSEGATSFVGLTRSDGDVAGPFHLSMNQAGCPHDAIAAAADAAAASAGWVPSAYDHVMYALPSTAECPWSGVGNTPGRRTWINGQLITYVTAHELGHNLAADHANSMSCTNSAGAQVTFSSSCASQEYGDPYDVMGNRYRLMSSWHRAQIGQLPTGQLLELRQSGSVTLTSADEFGTPGTRLVLVPIKEPHLRIARWLAIETRSTSSPFDVWSDGFAVTSGLSLRLVPDLAVSAQSQLLDARPDTATSDDAPLQVGEVFRDDAHAITVRAEAVAGGQLRAVVTMPPVVDDIAPAPPDELRASGDTAGVRVTWSTAYDDSAVDHYEVERDGAIIGTTPGLSFRDERVAELTHASYRVVAVDTSGNRASSHETRVTLSDATPPSDVPGLRVSIDGAVITLSWSAAQDNRAVRGYRVARAGLTLDETPETSLRDTPGAGTYRYDVRAIDAAGNVGPPSSVDATPAAVTAAAVTPPTSAVTVAPFTAMPTRPAPSSAPAITRLGFSPSTFRAARSGPTTKAGAARTGTRVSYTLRMAARVRFTIERCATAAKHNNCTRFVRIPGSFTRSRPAGADRFTFTGRLAGRALKPGRYRLVATASAGGRTATPAHARFRIRRAQSRR